MSFPEEMDQLTEGSMLSMGESELDEQPSNSSNSKAKGRGKGKNTGKGVAKAKAEGKQRGRQAPEACLNCEEPRYNGNRWCKAHMGSKDAMDWQAAQSPYFDDHACPWGHQCKWHATH